ncbi:MAG: hypothetical protein ACI9LG_001119 [Moritella dasanensis]|jgi:hypothetical protein
MPAIQRTTQLIPIPINHDAGKYYLEHLIIGINIFQFQVIAK